jgi:cytolysin-activating lysine-acyltransferase
MFFGSRKSAAGEDKTASGAAHGPAPPISAPAATAGAAEEAQLRARRQARAELTFARMVSVLMRSDSFKHHTLGDLEWLVVPALVSGQFSLAEARAPQNRPTTPVAVALWATVSADVDKRLRDAPKVPPRLRPDEWRSGDNLWLMLAVGDRRVLGELLAKLSTTVFKERTVWLRSQYEKGEPTVTTLEATLKEYTAAAEKPAALN